MENRVVVFTSDSVIEAEIVKSKLEAEGISALLLNQKDSSYQAFGQAEIYVLEADAERAKEIIAQSNE